MAGSYKALLGELLRESVKDLLIRVYPATTYLAAEIPDDRKPWNVQICLKLIDGQI